MTDAFTYRVADARGLTDLAQLVISITGANDAPVITSNGGGAAAAVSVAENTTAVTTVTASDPDAGATRSFSLAAGGADNALFAINATTGVLTFLAPRNFEAPGDAGANNIYNVKVQVSDGALVDVQDIAVTVTNANEAPVITSNGGGAAAAVSVAENTTAVTTVTASDPDAGANADLFPRGRRGGQRAVRDQRHDRGSDLPRTPQLRGTGRCGGQQRL